MLCTICGIGAMIGVCYVHGSHHTSGGSSGCGNRRINAEVKNNFDTNQCSFFQGTTYHATEPIVMIWEAESPNTGDDMTLFSSYPNGENVRAQVAEIQIYDSSLSTYERLSLECGLAEKWGISYVSAKCVRPPLLLLLRLHRQLFTSTEHRFSKIQTAGFCCSRTITSAAKTTSSFPGRRRSRPPKVTRTYG